MLFPVGAGPQALRSIPQNVYGTQPNPNRNSPVAAQRLQNGKLGSCNAHFTHCQSSHVLIACCQQAMLRHGDLACPWQGPLLASKMPVQRRFPTLHRPQWAQPILKHHSTYRTSSGPYPILFSSFPASVIMIHSAHHNIAGSGDDVAWEELYPPAFDIYNVYFRRFSACTPFVSFVAGRSTAIMSKSARTGSFHRYLEAHLNPATYRKHGIAQRYGNSQLSSAHNHSNSNRSRETCLAISNSSWVWTVSLTGNLRPLHAVPAAKHSQPP